jgi:uncharacterized protein
MGRGLVERDDLAAAKQAPQLGLLGRAHTGNQSRSKEEAEAIVAIVRELLVGGQWRDREQRLHALTERNIRIVAPYNAQVAALSEALPALRERIGTVDRFQGQKAPVVIYSMTFVEPRGCAARNGVPLQPQSLQLCDGDEDFRLRA